MGELSKLIDSEIVFKLSTMVADTFPPLPVDATFLHGRAKGDDTNLLEHTALMHRLGLSPKIVILGNEGQKVNDDTPHGANPGMSYYRQKLEGLGIPSDHINHIADVPSERHTRGESLGFLRLAKTEGWISAAFPTQPHQSWRALAGTISAISEIDHKILAFYLVPFSTNWQEIVPGSQGQEEKPREEHFQNEASRIPFYTQKGDIATPKEILDYLQWRQSYLTSIPTYQTIRRFNPAYQLLLQ